MKMISSSPSFDAERILSSAISNLSVAPSHDDHFEIRPDVPTIDISNENKVDDYMHSQPEITAKMRSNVIDWLVELHNDFELDNRTLYLTVSIIDRFLAAENVPKIQLLCVGLTSLLIAIKFEEVRDSEVLDIQDLSEIVSGKLTPLEFATMEKRILARLKWRVFVPTPYCYLTRFIVAVLETSETIMENMVYFYAELGLMNYETIRFSPSTVAAGALYAACATLGRSHLWHETLEKETGFKEMQVMDCAKMLVGFHSYAKRDKIRKNIFAKYSCHTRGAVALYPPAKYLLKAAKTLSVSKSDR